MTNAMLIVAAGRGHRMGAPLPKQYLPLGEGTVLRTTIKAALSHPAIDLVQVVIGDGDAALYESSAGDLPALAPVTGGSSRQASVLNGLHALAPHAAARVLVHDGARPFLSHSLIDRVLGGLDTAPGALPVTPVTDSIKRVEDGKVIGEEDRTALAAAQTPQGFRFADILDAHESAIGQEQTDDAAIARLAGLEITTVEGDPANFKITTADDLTRARALINDSTTDHNPRWETRTGMGFDVHRFAEGRPMMLCGVGIPYRLGLAGHSDADVGLHAITDAIFGAIAEGDIGDHFPPEDDKWRGASSDRFLAHAGLRVAGRGGRLTFIDVTLICEAPKIKPHRRAMRERIATILDLPVSRVSVKATTTEKLGFTGRREGIAAQAIATLVLPAEIP